MNTSALLFRFRYPLHVLVLGFGLFLPWNRMFGLDPAGPNAHTWGVMAAWLAQHFVLGIGAAFDLLLVVGIVLAFAAAALRTWASACVGAGVVGSSRMVAGVVACGPYRFLRNPLYWGTLLHTLALALLMPPAGALFSVVVITALQVALVHGEERFLHRTLGSQYEAYTRLVPRVLPALRPRVAHSGLPPRWAQAVLGEIYMWGVAFSYVAAGWQFNASLLVRCVLVSMGVAIIVRALEPARWLRPESL